MILKENVNWEKIKNNVTKEKPTSFFEITDAEYMEKWLKAITWGWITKSSQITVYGYSVYVGTCLALDETSLLGGPLVKSKSPAVAINLEDFKIITLTTTKSGVDYTLNYDGPGYLEVLIRCIRGQGEPRHL